MWVWIAAAAVVYIFLKSPPGSVIGKSTPGGGSIVTGPFGSRLSNTTKGFGLDIPGVGSYQNAYGQNSGFQLDPNLLQRLWPVDPSAPTVQLPVTQTQPEFAYNPAAEPPAAVYVQPSAPATPDWWAETGADYFTPTEPTGYQIPYAI
jgi:hypothetical protein